MILENPFQLIFIIFQPCYNGVGGQQFQQGKSLDFQKPANWAELVSSNSTSSKKTFFIVRNRQCCSRWLSLLNDPYQGKFHNLLPVLH